MCYKTEKYTVCKCVRASFSPDILHAGAVKGLNLVHVLQTQCQQAYTKYNSQSLCESMSINLSTGAYFAPWTKHAMTYTPKWKNVRSSSHDLAFHVHKNKKVHE